MAYQKPAKKSQLRKNVAVKMKPIQPQFWQKEISISNEYEFNKVSEKTSKQFYHNMNLLIHLWAKKLKDNNPFYHKMHFNIYLKQASFVILRLW